MPHKNIVWMNGSFDVLHIGHIKLLQRARQMGLPVMIGIGTDDYYQSGENANSNPPITPLKDRIEFLKSIKYVDAVAAYATDDELLTVIAAHSPRYMMIADDLGVGFEGLKDEIIASKGVKEIIYTKVNGTHKT